MTLKHSKRIQKRITQRIRYGTSGRTAPVFLFGCQRSGTKMVLRALARAPEMWEHDHRPFDPVYLMSHDPAYRVSSDGTMARLLGPAGLRGLLDRTPAPYVVFHALADSQEARILLDAFPDARGIWIYRHYGDVARSMVRLWGDLQTRVVTAIRDGDSDSVGWRGEGLTAAMVKTISDHYQPDISALESAALFWYLRNQFLFEQTLHDDSRVLLACYEDLVTDGGESFRRLFDFVGCSFQPGFVREVFASSVSGGRSEGIRSSIAGLCEGLLAQLNAWRNPETGA